MALKTAYLMAGVALVGGGAICADGREPATNGRASTAVVQEIDQAVWASLRAQLAESFATKQGQVHLEDAIREKIEFLSPTAQRWVIQATKGTLGQFSMELEVGGSQFLITPSHGVCTATLPESDSRAFVTTRVWPDGDVFYRFSDEIVDLFEDPPDEPDVDETNALQSIPNTIAAMLVIEAQTSIRFIGYDPTVHGDGFVMIESNGPMNGCFNAATVGFTGGENFFSVCNWSSIGTIVHELGHSIGLFHEHQRPNRDNFVEIKEQNIAPAEGFPFTGGGASQFEKLLFTGAMLGPYDYMSVMHYPADAFSILDELPTICVLPPNEALQDVIGTGSFFSDRDIAAIQALNGNDDIWTWDPTSLCPTDVDNNHIVDVTDILLFLGLLNTQNIFADLNSDGRWDFFDVTTFMSRWVPGYCDPTDPINPFGRPTVRPG